MLGKITNSTSKYNILAPVYVCEDNNTLLFIEIYIIRIFFKLLTLPLSSYIILSLSLFYYYLWVQNLQSIQPPSLDISTIK